MVFETWGKNKYHDPKICEDCISNSCPVCSNGPRLAEYSRAVAEARLKRKVITEFHLREEF